MNDPNIIPVNIFGFALNLIYFLVYYYYTPDSVNKLFYEYLILIFYIVYNITFTCYRVHYFQW